MRYALVFIQLAVLQLAFSNNAFAAEPQPAASEPASAQATSVKPTMPSEPWLQPEVLKAAGGIGLTEEQMPGFRTAISDLVNNRAKAINRVMGKNNLTNVKRKVRVASKRQFKKMDKAMAGLLTDEQYPRYETYRDLLSKNLNDATRRRTGSSADAIGQTSAGLDGFSDTQ